MPKLTYTWRMRLLALAAVVGTIVFGVIAGRVARLGEPGEYFGLVFPALLALAALLALVVWYYWRAMDDVQKSGQVNSWYWGGCTGALVFFLYLIADRTLQSDYGQGAFAIFSAQIAGFALMWVIWKLRGMGRAE